MVLDYSSTAPLKQLPACAYNARQHRVESLQRVAPAGLIALGRGPEH